MSESFAHMRLTVADPKVRSSMIAVTMSVMLAIALGWLGTSSWLSMGINWDAAGYSADIGRGEPWGEYPWNSHYGAWQVYWVAMHLARGLGGTLLDGLRGLNAVALACSAAILALCALRWKLSATLAIFVAGIYLLSWGTLLLVFTWEDNVLVHPGALAALAVCIFRIGKWRPRDSVVAGACVGIASLMSWQGASYGLPVLYAAAFLAGPRPSQWARIRDLALIPLALVATRAAWVLFYWLTAMRLSLAKLLRIAFERPSPNYLPQRLSGWWALLCSWRQILEHLGIGVTHEAGPVLRDAAGIVRYLPYLGAFLLVFALLFWMATNLVHRNKSSLGSQFLAAAFLALTLASAIYLDLPVDKYKRYDYIPMFLSLGAALLAARLMERYSPMRKAKMVLTLGLVLVLVGEGLLALRWNRQWYAKLPASAPANYLGHENQTWFAYMRSLRKAHPDACSFLLAFDEVKQGRYQLEIPAALFSELPHAVVVGAPAYVRGWPRPLPVDDGSAVQKSRQTCAWVSPSAKAVLAVQQIQPRK